MHKILAPRGDAEGELPVLMAILRYGEYTYVNALVGAAVHIVTTAALANEHVLHVFGHLGGTAVGAGQEEVATHGAIAYRKLEECRRFS